MVDFVDGLDPSCNLFGVLVRLLQGSHYLLLVLLCGSHSFEHLAQLELEDRGVRLVQSWFIDHREAEVFLVGVRTRRFDESIDFTDCWDEVGDERFDFGLDFNGLGFVASYVLKQLLDFR